MDTKEPDSRLSVRKQDLDDKELYRLNAIINDLYSKVSTARDETANVAKQFKRSGVIASPNDQSKTPPPPPPSTGIPQPAAGDWSLNPVIYSAGEDGLQYGFASATISNKSAAVDYYSMFIQDYSSGYVNTSGTTVTLTSDSKEAGNTFERCVKDQVININGVAYILAADAVAPFESVTLTTSAGTQSNVYFNLNPIDGRYWEEIASDAEAGTWQLRPPQGWDVPCCLTASTKTEKVYQPADGVNYKRLVFAPWGDAPQVTNFSVTIEQQDPATTDIPGGKFVVNFTKPLDPEYNYASVERLWYVNNTFSGDIGATAIVDVSGNTVTYNSTSPLYDANFKGQYFNYIQPGDTVYIGTASTLTDTNTYIVSEVISNTQLKLTTSPTSGTGLLFAQWGRLAGEINPFTQTDYWPLPTNAEYWKFRCRSVNHREIANNTSIPTVNVTVPASGGITPLTPPTQLGSSAWSLNPLQYSTDQAGNSAIFISATITTPSTDADYYSLFWQKTSGPPVAGAWEEIAADAIAGTWREWPSAGATYIIAIAANKNTYKLDQPDTSIPSYYKSLIIPPWGPADQVTNFSVVVETGNRGGVPSGRFVFNFTKPADPDYYYAQISRIATDSSYNPISANATDLTSAQNGGQFEIVTVGSTDFTLIGASSNTVGTVFTKSGGTGSGTGTVKTAYGIVAGEINPTKQSDWWPLPATAEYWKFKSESVNYRKEVNTTSPPTSNVSVSTSSGITQIAPATITTAAFASTIRPVELVAALPSLPSGSYPQGAIVFLTTNNKLYRSTGSTWTVATDGADIVANSITGGKIAAGAISTTELFAGEILVGAGGGKPTRFTVVDASSNVVGFIGDITSPAFTGGYFKNLLVAPSLSTTAIPRLYANTTGGTINATSLTSAENGRTYQIVSIGTTDFTLIGAASNTIGAYFVKSGSTGTGTGTVSFIGLELVGMPIESTNSNPAAGFSSGTVRISPGNLYGAVQVFSSSSNSLSAISSEYVTVRSNTSSNWYPYCELYRTSTAAIIRAFADPLLNSYVEFWTDATPANSYANFKGVPIKINNTTAIDTSRNGSFVNLTATGTLTAGGSTGTSGQVLTSTGSGIQWSTSTSGVTSINSMTGPAITISASTGISIANATNTVTISNIGVTSITGTANQVIASASTGSVTLNLPQSIATTSSVTFGSLTLSSSGIGITGYGTVFSIAGTNLYIDNQSGNDIYLRPATGRYVIASGTALISSGSTTLGNSTFPWPSLYTSAYYANDSGTWKAGATGTFTTADSKTVSVVDGIIVSIV